MEMNSLGDLMYVHTSVNSCIPEIRSIISMASGIKLENIRNGLSIRGADLVRQSGNALLSFQPEDSFIIFYLKPTDDTNITTTEPDGSISNIISLQLNMNIYGNDCVDRQQRLKSRIKSDKYRDLLDQYGFVIRSMNNGTLFTEAINDIFYLRTDTSLDFDAVISYPADETDEICDCNR